MMELLVAEKTQYEIQRCLGSGLTSEVYKAFRKDSKGFTQQTVALKLIKSRKDVQILKKEFENLSQVQSKYCVQILAWENFNLGPALVLEFIEGVTLENLYRTNRMNSQDWLEILCQVRLGLTGLHQQGIFHGDLNLKNIMVNKQGVVKIIDFGFGGEQEQCLTPMFASPGRMRGEPPTAHSDFISLQKLGEYLLKSDWGQTSFDKETPRGWRRRSLAQKVSMALNQKSDHTIKWSPTISSSSHRPCLAFVVACLLVFAVGLWPDSRSYKAEYVPLSLRSHNWFRYSVGGSPTHLGPAKEIMLRKGKYDLKWQTAQTRGLKNLELDTAKTFLLNPSAKAL